jgi:hypothetical protein
MLLSTLNQLISDGSKVLVRESVTKGGRGLFVTQDCFQGDLLVTGILPLAYTTHKVLKTSTSSSSTLGSTPTSLSCHLCHSVGKATCTVCARDDEGAYSELKQIAEKVHTHTQSQRQSLSHTEQSVSNKPVKLVYDDLIKRLTLRVIEERKRSFENTLFTLLSLSSPDITDMLRLEANTQAQAQADSLHAKARDLETLARKVCKDDGAVTACFSSGKIFKRRNSNSPTGTSDDENEVKETDLAVQWYAHVWGILYLNCISTPIGTALYGILSFINHSCKPNVGLRFRDNSVCVDLIALEDMKAGQEVYIHYVEGNDALSTATVSSFQARQEHLQFNYGFKCSPQSCTCEHFTISNIKQS